MSKKVFKKLICFILVFCIAFLNSSLVLDAKGFSGRGSKHKPHNPKIVEFHDDLENMIASENETMYAAVNQDNFSSKRIVVMKSFDSLESEYGAMQVAESILGVTILQYDSEADAQSAYQQYVAQYGADSVEVDQVYKTCDTLLKTTDFAAGNTYHYSDGVEQIESDTYISKMNEQQKNKNIVVAVVDTGICLSHPAFSGSLVSGSGYYNNGNPNDDNGHGTHVAGIIHDVTKGCNVKLMPIKVLDSSGYGYNTTIAAGIQYAVEHGANVINLSLGGYDTSSSHYLDLSIRNAIAMGITVVAASGNEGVSCDTFCPAHIPGVLCVGAVDSDNTLAYFSNYGNNVGLVAPGVDIYSTYLNNSYTYMSGTSMATPHASGAVALLKASANYTPAQIIQLLENAAIDQGKPGWDLYYGHGALNLAQITPGTFDYTPDDTVPDNNEPDTDNPDYNEPDNDNEPDQDDYPSPWDGWKPPTIPDNTPQVPMHGISVSTSSSFVNGRGIAKLTLTTGANINDVTVLLDGNDAHGLLQHQGNNTYEITMTNGGHSYYISYGGSTCSGSF